MAKASSEVNILKVIENFKEISFFKKQEQNYYIKRANFLSEQIMHNEFRITVVGEYSAGKSTFLNALIGRDLLPHAVDETTATITYIHNVPENDSRENKIKINFFDENKASIELDFSKNINVLKEYTTTKSQGVKVVDEIESVDIYVHFTGIDESLVFVDTPGLNGVAKGHRERTLHEIKQAHASICLFHLRSVATSNLEFLKLLSEYQQSFLFVLNFIDELKQSEGETYEGKMESFKRDLLQNLYQGKEDVDLKVFGVSALKGLAAKDRSIKRLYQNDYQDLTTDDRKRIWPESNFAKFEKQLWEYVANGEKNLVFQEALSFNLNTILNDALEELTEMTEVFKLSVTHKQKLEIEGKIDKFDRLFDRNWEKVSRFIASRENELEKAFRARVDKDIEMTMEKLKAEIKNANFDDFEEALKINKYGVLLETKVTQHKDIYQEQLGEILEEIYQSAILRIQEYHPSIEIDTFGKVSNIDFKKEIETSFKDYTFEDRIKQLTNKKIDQELKQENLEKEIITTSRAMENAEKELAKLEPREKEITTNFSKQKSRLGTKPNDERKTVTRDKTVERAKLSVFRAFGSTTKTIEVTETITDTSKREKWNNKHDVIKRKYLIDKEQLHEESTKLNYRKRKLNQSKQNNQELKDRIEMKLTQIEKDIARKNDEYEEIIKKAKAEYLKNEKKRLMEQISSILSNQIIFQIKDSITKNIQGKIEEVKNLTNEYYKKSLLSYKRKLKVLMEETGKSKDSQEMIEINQAMIEINKLHSKLNQMVQQGELS